MNPNYIKFLAGYATGYEIINPDDEDMILRCPDGVEFYMFDFFEKEPVYYSDFLQKAIEGINKDTDYEIIQYSDAILVNPKRKEFEFYKTTKDQAKNSALEYVWKREGE